ncbi:FAD synthetase family protein [Pseudonocardia bannensis]|nr:FAD synthetase family protein [Pseudonocardia bannensis]
MHIAGRPKIEELSVTEPAHRTGGQDAVARLSALLRPHRGPSVVTMGTFDGVHDGHAALLAHAKGLATARGLRTIAVTFSPRPDQVLSPEHALPDIVPIAERVDRLRASGVDDVVVIPFDRALATVTAERFARLLATDLAMRTLCVGEDFALGHNREGSVAYLRGLGVDVVACPLVRTAGRARKISSSVIRRAIADGVAPDQAWQAA